MAFPGKSNLNFPWEKFHWNNHHHHHHHHLQSLNCKGHWGTTDDFATSFLHFSLFSTALWDLPNSRPVHSLMLSSHLFLCPPCLLPPRWFWPDLKNGKHDHTMVMISHGLIGTLYGGFKTSSPTALSVVCKGVAECPNLSKKFHPGATSTVRLEAAIHCQTQFHDPISCHGKPAGWTSEIAYPLISMVRSTAFPRAHLHVVGMLWSMILTKTHRACPLLFIPFECLFLSLQPFQLYFIP